jgi:hypothetical protein
VWFKIWLLVQPENAAASVSGYSSILASASEEFYGPFLVKSVQSEGGTKLDIDVDNLIKPDGTKGSIPAGPYKIRFADDSPTPTYVGTTDTVELPATKDSSKPDPTPGDDTPGGDEPSDEGSGGGCDAGFGATGLAGALVTLAVAAKGSKRERRQ